MVVGLVSQSTFYFLLLEEMKAKQRGNYYLLYFNTFNLNVTYLSIVNFNIRYTTLHCQISIINCLSKHYPKKN